MFYVFLRVIPSGGEETHKQNTPPNSRENYVYVFFVFVFLRSQHEDNALQRFVHKSSSGGSPRRGAWDLQPHLPCFPQTKLVCIKIFWRSKGHCSAEPTCRLGRQKIIRTLTNQGRLRYRMWLLASIVSLRGCRRRLVMVHLPLLQRERKRKRERERDIYIYIEICV